MGWTEFLKAGAIGIGLAILVYTAALLKQELAKPEPRPDAKSLILTFMAFSLVLFGIATFIELRERSGTIIGIVNGMDANLGGKEQAAVQSLDRNALKFFDNELCKRVKDLRSFVGEDGSSECVVGQ